jgi:hypothetical protein
MRSRNSGAHSILGNFRGQCDDCFGGSAAMSSGASALTIWGLVSTVSEFGGDFNHPLAVTSISPTYGIIGADYRCPVRLSFDHRVFDAALVAHALVRLDAILNTLIADELRAAALAAPANCLRIETGMPGKNDLPKSR